MKAILVLPLFLFTSFLSPLYACPVCFVGKEGTIATYLSTAVVLSLLPLAMVGAFSIWIYRRYRTSDYRKDHPEAENPVYSKQQPVSMD